MSTGKVDDLKEFAVTKMKLQRRGTINHFFHKVSIHPMSSRNDTKKRNNKHSHDAALVVTLSIANYTTQKILVDNGSSTNILLWDAFTKMGIDLNLLTMTFTHNIEKVLRRCGLTCGRYNTAHFY